jgi:ribosomal protein S18 acetylase RimI-like enzyme
MTRQFGSPTPASEIKLPDEFRIVVARRLDALPTLQIHRQVLAEEKWFFIRQEELADSMEDRERMVRAYAESDNSVFLVAKRGRQVVGFVFVEGGQFQRNRHSGKLQVMVAEFSRGLGIGTALVQHALSWGAENAIITKVGLNVFADNERATKVYRELGFVEEGRLVGEYKDADGTLRDGVLMYRKV